MIQLIEINGSGNKEMTDLYYEVKTTSLNNNLIIRYKQTRLPIVMYKFGRPQNDDYTLFNVVDDFKRSYIYFLVGIDKNDSMASIYIGQSSMRNKSASVFQRIKEHNTELWSIDWDTAYILTRNDENMDETCLNYLEHYFYSLVKSTNIYKLWNALTPSEGHPSEAQEADLRADIAIWHQMFNIAGFCLGEKRTTAQMKQALLVKGLYQDSVEINDKTYNIHFYSLKSKSGAIARICKIDKFYKTKASKHANDYFIILKGSRLSETYSLEDFNDSNCKNAREYILRYCLEDGCLSEDIPVTSATSASTVIKGKHCGRTNDWKEIPGALTEEQRNRLASPPFWYIQYNEINAVLVEEGIRYRVLKGSHISFSTKEDRNDTQTIRYIKKRRQLETDGIISNSVFTQDYIFNSKSMAEGVIQGKKMSANWKRYCDFGYIDIARENR